ncbi:MAG: hypothetical protein QG669_70 [Patescibacteria group bacterium]|jgi:hypothetical protein|nr:hypothetical protein [Patescibacteria group bacterium]MDQ5961678.1 hypothetical protein [Patescibacteria group bacterium]
MRKKSSIIDRLGNAFDYLYGEKRAYFAKALSFIAIGLVVVMAYLKLLSLAEGTEKSLYNIALSKIKEREFWLSVGLGILLGTSGLVVIFFKFFPWVKRNPGVFTFVLAGISIFLGFIGLNNESGFLSLVSNTVVIILIIGYFSKPAYDNWKAVKSFNRKITNEYGRGLGAESRPWVEKSGRY